MSYLGDLLLSEISKVSIIQWQNELMKMKGDKGQSYSPTYLRTIHAQLSSILNHACKFYNLKNNVVLKDYIATINNANGTFSDEDSGGSWASIEVTHRDSYVTYSISY